MGTRLIMAVLAAANSFLGSLWRIARQLFHETTGALFFVFAALGATAAWHEWQRGSSQWVTALAIGFAAMMAAFAVACFRSARRVR